MSARENTLPTLHDMLVVEDDPALLEFLCGGTSLPLWPQVRLAMFRMMMSDLLYGNQLTGKSSTPASWGRATATLARSVAHNAWQRFSRRQRAGICITGDGVADQMIEGRWFNRLADHFVATRPAESVLLIDHFEWHWAFPRRHGRVILHAPLQANNAIRGKLGVNALHRRQASDLVRLIDERARRHLQWALDAQRALKLTDMLARKVASMPWQYDAYDAMLKRIRPKVLMVGAGCYGPAASLIAAAKARGIGTAEYQHGAVSAGHDAYNFAPSIRDSELYRKTLPDYFLGYGTWWNEQINAPLKKLAIGSPHRAARLAALEPGQGGGGRDLLVLSDGIELNLYLDLARQLCPVAQSAGLRVVLRPHPLERTRALALREGEKAGVTVDPHIDLYASLRTARVVVSEVSTGLFEAVGIAERIFMWDTPKSRFSYPRHPFQSFSSIPELLELLEHDCQGRLAPGLDTEAIWVGDWRNRYVRFLNAHGVP